MHSHPIWHWTPYLGSRCRPENGAQGQSPATLESTRPLALVKLANGPQLLFAVEFVYAAAIPAVKMSVIMFYSRIFAVDSFKWAFYFCTFIVVGWWIGVTVTVAVQCKPYQHLWLQYVDPTAKGECIDLYGFFLGNGIAEAITDFIILIVPIPMVWQLQMPTGQKLAVLGIFFLGGL